MRLTHVRVLVDDFASMADFYGRVLGFEMIVDAASIGYAEFAAGDAVVAIYDHRMMARVIGVEASVKGKSVTTYDVADVDGTFERLVSAGAHPVARPHDQPTWGFRIAVVADPEGNLIEINHSLPDRTDLSG